jgi:KTSC domain
MVRLNSSAISAVDYNERSLNLNITFTSGDTYTYYLVPAWKYAGLISASSAGQYFNDNIRDQHTSNRG